MPACQFEIDDFEGKTQSSEWCFWMKMAADFKREKYDFLDIRKGLY